MGGIMQNIAGLCGLTDEVIAHDLLSSAKSSVSLYALALTEAATPEVRATLKRQLDDAIMAHEQVLLYLMNKNWYLPYQLGVQIQKDLVHAEKALQSLQG